jgi:glyoxylase I family protein
MTAELTKDSIDIGIVITDIEKSIAFYHDLLGFEQAGELAMPGGGTMYRLMCGTSAIKLILPGHMPPAVAPPGGIQGATGYRYCTISVSNIEELVTKCIAAGHPVPVPVTLLRPGISIAIVADPDGNWVEFVQTG